jgi:hypothetical protein
MSENLGAGIALDEQLDFGVDPSGDVESSSGPIELRKDLAIQMIIGLDRYIGEPPSGNIEAKVAGSAKQIALNDPRVLSVRDDSIIVNYSTRREEISIEMNVITEDGEIPFVFDV